MARITVEDCLEKIQNHFDLVLLASKRARDLSRVEQPAQALLDRNNDKPAVVALREIAAGLVDMSYLEEKPDMEEEEENILAKFQGMQPMKPVDRAYHFDEEDDDVEEAARVEEPAEPVREAEIAVAKTDKASADAAEGAVAVAKTDEASADAAEGAVAVVETDEASADVAVAVAETDEASADAAEGSVASRQAPAHRKDSARLEEVAVPLAQEAAAPLEESPSPLEKSPSPSESLRPDWKNPERRAPLSTGARKETEKRQRP